MQRYELETVIENMKPGERVVYHVGNLMKDRNFGPEFMQVDNTATAAWDAMEAGKVALVQRCEGGPNPFGLKQYHYIAVKCPSPYERVYWSGCYDPNSTKEDGHYARTKKRGCRI